MSDDLADRMVERAERAVAAMSADGAMHPAPADPRSLIDIPVRPEADAFHMLDGEAFVALAVGIRDHGQLEPIELDEHGAIGDGRNRYAACRWLGIEPRSVTLPPGIDWFARVVERNLNRRHATPGARAIALVKAGASQGSSTRKLSRLAGISDTSILRARFLVEHDKSDLIRQVEDGASLRAAYDAAVGLERGRTDAEREAVDAEAARIGRLEDLERERARLVAALASARDDIGAAVVIPSEPELEIVVPRNAEGEVSLVEDGRSETDVLREQEAMLKAMKQVKAQIVTLSERPVPAETSLLEGHVLAVRSWATQVVSVVYGMVEAYNAALSGAGQVRRIK